MPGQVGCRVRRSRRPNPRIFGLRPGYLSESVGRHRQDLGPPGRCLPVLYSRPRTFAVGSSSMPPR